MGKKKKTEREKRSMIVCVLFNALLLVDYSTYVQRTSCVSKISAHITSRVGNFFYFHQNF
jgi:hypothetical protein